MCSDPGSRNNRRDVAVSIPTSYIISFSLSLYIVNLSYFCPLYPCPSFPPPFFLSVCFLCRISLPMPLYLFSHFLLFSTYRSFSLLCLPLCRRVESPSPFSVFLSISPFSLSLHNVLSSTGCLRPICLAISSPSPTWLKDWKKNAICEKYKILWDKNEGK